ncbi:hypothetical protein [Thermomonospora cellulosilytica]|uniref:Uncharacterized protein n=1 Tax=Thermomonospora cellulosilytica TaxID=1411118 RepID=A0A7W3N1B5_9ACTN|nr:hypothetical protein [Thermomonospora cellulosilytica]MBA9005708.1 hypothetical protein [Thermomonospora cellulosilytica]
MIELVFEPFDLTALKVRWNGEPMVMATPDPASWVGVGGLRRWTGRAVRRAGRLGLLVVLKVFVS